MDCGIDAQVTTAAAMNSVKRLERQINLIQGLRLLHCTSVDCDMLLDETHNQLVISYNESFGRVSIEFVLPVVEKSIAISGIVSNSIILTLVCVLGFLGWKWGTGD